MIALNNLPEISLAALVLCLMALPPGWLFLHVVHLPTGRTMLPVAVLIGMLIVPLAFNVTAAILPGPLTLPARVIVWGGLLASLGLVAVLAHRHGSPGAPPRFDFRWQAWALLAIGLVAVVVTAPSLIEHNVEGNAGWKYISLADWSKHVGMGTALMTDDHLPSQNPFLSTDHAFRYYYFSYVLPSMVPRLTGHVVSVANSLIALALVVAFAFPFLVYHFGRAVGLTAGGALVGAFLPTLVSGLDLIYNTILRTETGYWPLHVDAWMPFFLRRIDALSVMFTWTFQHTLGIAAAVLILWLLLRPVIDVGRMIGAALLIAALMGTSTVVWFPCMAGLGAFLLVEFARYTLRRTNVMLSFMLPAGALAMAFFLSVPYLRLLADSNTSVGPELHISPTLHGIRHGSVFSEMFGPSDWTFALDFPLQMIPEFGLVLITGLAGLWLLRRAWASDPAARLLIVNITVYFFIILAVREGRSETNNYAPRTAGLAWTLLGVTSGFWWMARQRSLWWRWLPLRALLAIMLVIGLATTAYEPLIVHTIPAFVDQRQHELHEWLNDTMGRQDVYLVDRQTSGEMILFIERQTAFHERGFIALYASRREQYDQAVALIDTAYTTFYPSEAAAALHQLNVTFLVLSAGNMPACMSHPNFTTYFSPVYQNPRYFVMYINEPPDSLLTAPSEAEPYETITIE
ncbi:MAG: hypothetical protein JW966_00865 [Anaerolineae bacterium]|nr:hypothetical protein [Anaerolineae bacterium]